MIETGIDPIEISDTERISVYLDIDSYGMDWIVGDELGVYTIDIARNFHQIEQGDRTSDLDRLMRNLGNDYRTDGRERRLRATELYLTMAGLNYKQVSLRGSMQSDWAEVIIYGNDMDLDSCVEGLQAWFSGEVFTIAHEKLATYTHATDPDRTIERWEIEDSIGCLVFSKDYTFDIAADDHFGHLMTTSPTPIHY
jgi:hypothetical protein